ncbi:type II secretion system protein E [Denitrovibrio acetiphilus DSM 12809]|uniref:Type II secretion system protein E n=1 Tax=Denitrovibrio acetiphilus (strain DSM 12809 / NBRC 114555 / N2460) TaxID=522772 RepID=D4H2S6_DENA2|nr:GspE/PulE family protein [Denitrovibrio acetiphilus]ADD67137.1 type II secretion system protein E [Denitrovibrio acetiphilus DSM 12809]
MAEMTVGELLKESGCVTEEQIRIALEIKKINKKMLGEILVDLSFVSPREVAIVIARQADKPFIDISEHPPSADALRLIDRHTAKQLEAIPIENTEKRLTVALADPFNINTIDILRRKTNKQINVYVADRESILKNIETNYHMLECPIDKEIQKLIDSAVASGITSEPPLLVEHILNSAIIERATDIHISPETSATHIFFRIDGILHHYYAFPHMVHSALSSRIKILSNLDIAEQRLPQDGAMSHSFFDEDFDVRVSTIPTCCGEGIVLRVLSKNISLFNLESLGFEPDTRDKLEKQLKRPHGILLVTGPTGSGKTTTLYASLRKINSLQRKILTAEDPIEYKFPFIKQTQLNLKAGYTFPRAMRAFLRQDPDVILLGEMRDEETAEMAMRASITGHLVLSTLHTNDAVTAIPRLMEMKIKDYMIASGVGGILSQRLIRKTCCSCQEETSESVAELISKGIPEEVFTKHGYSPDGEIIYKQGKGCAFCRNTGYAGRGVISELLVIDQEIGELIVTGATPMTIFRKAVTNGMIPIIESGLIKVMHGITTPDEILRVAL